MPSTDGRARLLGTALIAWAALTSGCGGGGPASNDIAGPTTPQTPPSGDCAPVPPSSLVVNVKDRGAKGDGLTNDTAAIQAAVDAVKGSGGTVLVPAGTYLVDPAANYNAGIRLGSDMTFRMDPGATLKAMSTTTSNYKVLYVAGVQNIRILGGTIVGNRYNNAITDTREGGDGISIVSSAHVVVSGVTVQDCWEDGFYVGATSQDVLLCSLISDGNRRQGLSITSVDRMLVKDSTFKNTTGFLENGAFVCGSGVDIEPDLGGTVNNVTFNGCTFSGNAAEGLAVGPAIANRNKAWVTNIVVDRNTATGNGTHDGAAGIGFSNTSGHKITNNTVQDNFGYGIYLRNWADQTVVTGNTVTGTKAMGTGVPGYGILLYDVAGDSITGNTVTSSAACGIRNAYPSDTTKPNTISPNTLSGNHPDTCP